MKSDSASSIRDDIMRLVAEQTEVNNQSAMMRRIENLEYTMSESTSGSDYGQMASLVDTDYRALTVFYDSEKGKWKAFRKPVDGKNDEYYPVILVNGLLREDNNEGSFERVPEDGVLVPDNIEELPDDGGDPVYLNIRVIKGKDPEDSEGGDSSSENDGEEEKKDKIKGYAYFSATKGQVPACPEHSVPEGYSIVIDTSIPIAAYIKNKAERLVQYHTGVIVLDATSSSVSGGAGGLYDFSVYKKKDGGYDVFNPVVYFRGYGAKTANIDGELAEGDVYLHIELPAKQSTTGCGVDVTAPILWIDNKADATAEQPPDYVEPDKHAIKLATINEDGSITQYHVGTFSMEYEMADNKSVMLYVPDGSETPKLGLYNFTCPDVRTALFELRCPNNTEKGDYKLVVRKGEGSSAVVNYLPIGDLCMYDTLKEVVVSGASSGYKEVGTATVKLTDSKCEDGCEPLEIPIPIYAGEGGGGSGCDCCFDSMSVASGAVNPPEGSVLAGNYDVKYTKTCVNEEGEPETTEETAGQIPVYAGPPGKDGEDGKDGYNGCGLGGVSVELDVDPPEEGVEQIGAANVFYTMSADCDPEQYPVFAGEIPIFKGKDGKDGCGIVDMTLDASGCSGGGHTLVCEIPLKVALDCEQSEGSSERSWRLVGTIPIYAGPKGDPGDPGECECDPSSMKCEAISSEYGDICTALEGIITRIRSLEETVGLGTREPSGLVEKVTDLETAVTALCSGNPCPRSDDGN